MFSVFEHVGSPQKLNLIRPRSGRFELRIRDRMIPAGFRAGSPPFVPPVRSTFIQAREPCVLGPLQGMNARWRTSQDKKGASRYIRSLNRIKFLKLVANIIVL
ncbi:hypothetical protein PoB_003815300 [Plakobranchus ocellatus]|uniref:Uncharacterized protein n=1 Tax=Plakobranchus ocellatus TaxID=259542 RepID=A0AAV4AWE9_9GAST|nr:hypothetical protein PoB_003815300 [Plakobranchus ocellatus]